MGNINKPIMGAKCGGNERETGLSPFIGLNVSQRSRNSLFKECPGIGTYIGVENKAYAVAAALGTHSCFPEVAYIYMDSKVGCSGLRSISEMLAI